MSRVWSQERAQLQEVGEADYAFWFCLKFDLTSSSVFVILLSFIE